MENNKLSQAINAALGALIVLQIIMLGSLYAQVAPHPPAETPIFAIAPFLAAALAAAVSAIVLGSQGWAGRGLSIFAALAAAISFGPQKYFDAQFAQIWPAVIAGQVAIVVILVITLKPRNTQVI